MLIVKVVCAVVVGVLFLCAAVAGIEFYVIGRKRRRK